MWGKLTASLGALAVLAAACARGEIVVRPAGGDEGAFVTQIADFEGDAGSGLSLAVDGEGNPHLAYLAFEDPPAAGGSPPAEVPDAPVLPAVKHAHVVGGGWSRSVVAEDQGGLGDPDATGIVVDAQGTHHVAWTAGGRMFYSSNAEGEFSEPQGVARPAAPGGVSIAVDGDGTPFVAFYGRDVSPALATLDGEQWVVEEVAKTSPTNPLSIAVGVAGSQVLVAFGDASSTVLARRDAGGWATEVADANGGTGVSMAIDADGNPHLAYQGPQSEVRHAHSIAGAPWETSTVAEAPATTTTSIAVAEDGVHHISWESEQGIGYATNAEGSFAEEDVPEAAAGGALPRLGAGPEGVVHLAWYDVDEGEVVLATRGGQEPLLAVPPASPAPGEPPAQPTGPPPCEPSGTELSIAAPQGAVTQGFSEDCLAAPAGQPFTIEFDNQDPGVPHNVAIYADSTATTGLFEPGLTIGEGAVQGPDTVTYEVDPIPDPGQYFFRCDFHPQTMTGTLVVA